MTESQVVVLPSAGDADGFVDLAKASPNGHLFRKQILKMNSSFVHPTAPGRRIRVDETLAKSLVKNFKDGIGDIVQVPIVGPKNEHTEDPTRNIGQVIDIDYDTTGIYATIDDRRTPEKVHEQGALGETLLGASALMHLDYTNTETDEHVGPTLLHVAVTNRPYLTNLDDYQALIAASADSLGEVEVLALADEADDDETPDDDASEEDELIDDQEDELQEEKMELDEMLAALKADHGIDVMALQAAAEHGQDDLVAAMSSVLQAAGTSVISDDDEDGVTIEDVANAVIELSGEKLELSQTVAALSATIEKNEQEKAEAEVDSLIHDGRILPKGRDAMISLSRTDREKFDALLPDDSIVQMSAVGVTVHDEPENETFTNEANRLAERAAEISQSRKAKK